MNSIGPSPLPSHMYAARHLPVQRVLFWLGRTFVVIAITVLVVAMLIISLYRLPSGSGLLNGFAQFLPLPAYQVNGTFVAMKKYGIILDGWSQLYESQGAVDFANSDIVAQRVEERVIRGVLIEQIMEELELELDVELVNTVYSEFVDQYQTEAHLIESVDRQFGWSVDQFMEYIVLPLARTRALDVAVSDWSEVQSQPRGIIQDIHAKVFNDPDIFAEIASEVSTSLSASDGGELGLRALDEYPPEARVILLSLDDGELSPIIDLDERFVIYQLIEKRERESGDLVNAREIAIDKKDVYDVIDERMLTAEIERYLQ